MNKEINIPMSKIFAILDSSLSSNLQELTGKAKFWGITLPQGDNKIGTISYSGSEIEEILSKITENEFNKTNDEGKALIVAAWEFVWSLPTPEYIDRYYEQICQKPKDEITSTELLAISLKLLDTDLF